MVLKKLKIIKTPLALPENTLLDTYKKQQKITDYYINLKKAIEENWETVFISDFGKIIKIPDEWISKNIKDEYLENGAFWHFKSKKDAVLFSLKWS